MDDLRCMLALLLCLVTVQSQKSGWTCGSDGYWYENGVRSSYSGCSGAKTDLDKTDSYNAGAGKPIATTVTTTGGTSKGGTASDPKTAGGTDGNYGWTCTGGFWTDANGAATTYPCQAGQSLKDPEFGDTSKGSGCTVTEMRSSAMASLPRTCIQHPSYADGRCWWTHVPNEVAHSRRQVPLLVDMHGGGGCASDQFSSSGFKAIADTNASGGGGMIVVWPQGGLGGLWASAGTSTRATSQATSGKSLPEWDDIGFLEQLVTYMIRNSTHKYRIDPERVYVSGFSLGCMMAHRFAMERSNLVAALGCHGGELSLHPHTMGEMDADKAAYNIQPMPAYLTIGDADAWFNGANASWHAWKHWNGCSMISRRPNGAAFTDHKALSCTSYAPALETVMSVIHGGPHAPDLSAYQRQWTFMSQYRRANALAAISMVPAVSPQPASSPSPSPVPGKDSPSPVVGASSHSFSHTWSSVMKTRMYGLVQLPSSCSGSPRGLVVILQPASGSCSPLETLSETSCILVACPYAESTGWKAFFTSGDGEDTNFIATLIQNLTTRYSIPAGNVIVTGFSFGGSMAYRVLCERSDVVGAIVPYGQAFLEPATGHIPKDAQDPSMTATQQMLQMMNAVPANQRCVLSHHRPHFALVGTQDSYYGQASGTYQGKTLWERYSTTVLGCTGNPMTVDPAAATMMTGQTGSICYHYASCPQLNASLNKYCTVDGMGHDTTGWAGFIAQSFAQLNVSSATPAPVPRTPETQCVPFVLQVGGDGTAAGCRECTSWPCTWKACSTSQPRICNSSDAR